MAAFCSRIVTVWPLSCVVLTAVHLPLAGDVAKLLVALPQVLLCKPSHNDRFDRRVVSLAAFRFRFGHVNVPEASAVASARHNFLATVFAIVMLEQQSLWEQQVRRLQRGR